MDLLDESNQEKRFLHKETPMWTASLFGGPFAGAFMIAHNFKMMEQPQNAKKTWLIACLVMVLNVLILFLSAQFGYLLLSAAPLINMTIANILLTKFQVDYLEKHQAQKGLFMKASEALLPSFLGFFFYAVPMIAVYVYWLYDLTFF